MDAFLGEEGQKCRLAANRTPWLLLIAKVRWFDWASLIFDWASLVFGWPPTAPPSCYTSRTSRTTALLLTHPPLTLSLSGVSLQTPPTPSLTRSLTHALTHSLSHPSTSSPHYSPPPGFSLQTPSTHFLPHSLIISPHHPSSSPFTLTRCLGPNPTFWPLPPLTSLWTT